MAKTEEKQEKKQEEKIKKTYEEITGLGVIVTQTFKENISTVFVPGAKIKNDKLVTLISD